MHKNFSKQKVYPWLMKGGLLAWFFLFFSIFSFGSIFPSEGQNVLQRNVSLSVENMKVKDILKKIEITYSIHFAYLANPLNIDRKASLSITDMPLRNVLAMLFDNSVTFEERGNLVIIKPVNVVAIDTEVSGKVTDEKGEPLPGVNVVVKGTTIGTITDAEGAFTLVIQDPNSTLIFSGITIETVEIALSGRNKLAVTVKTKISELDEVQIVAYGTTTRRLTTSSIAQMKGEDIRKQPVENPMLALGGRMPGLQISQTSGISGGPVSISIRGRNSLGAGSEPLYIIDGVPFAHSLKGVLMASGVSAQTLGGITSASTGTSPFVNLSLADIESIEVLKDADATAIYGSRGSNGVILITTKKGKSGKTSVDISYYAGVGRPTRVPELLNTQQYIEMRKEAFKNDGIVPTASNAPDLLAWDTNRYTDWSKLLIGKNARNSDLQVRLSGGSKQTNFSFSTGYHREIPVFYGNMYDNRINIRANTTHHSMDNKFSILLNIGYNNDNNNINTTDMGQLIFTVPNAPNPLDANGNLVWSENGINFSNPLQYIKKLYKGVTENFISNVNLGYRFSKSFEIKVDAGMNIIRLEQRRSNPLSSQSPLGTTPISDAQFFSQTQRNWIIEPQAVYTKQLGKGRIQVLVGGSFQEQLTETTDIIASGYTSDELLETPGPAATKTVTSPYAKYRYSATFAKVNYNFDNKYMINISGRRDGSSRFGPGRKFGNFGAIGAGWVFSEENFMKVFEFLNYGKIRTSVGVTGNDQIDNYGYITRWAATSSAIPYQGVNGLYPTGLENPDFGWENSRKWEAAIELGFLEDRLFVSGDFYLSRSDNQLVGYVLPTQVGFSNITANRNALIENRGWEFMVSATHIKSRDFVWKSSFNVTIPRNKLVAYPDLEKSSYSSLLLIGEPVTIRKYLEYQGVDATTGIYKLNGTDLNTDRTQIRNLGQRMYGGLQNTLTYKGWSLDFFFHFVQQQGLTSIRFQAPGGISNQPVQVLNRWQKEGDVTDVQKFSTTGNPVTQFSYYSNYSSARVVDASFIRLKNVSLSYQFDRKVLQNLKIENLRLYMQAQNLVTITNYQIGDPETLSITTAPLSIFSSGVQITF